MPAINLNRSILARNNALGHLAKRENWAQQEVGVVVVFVLVFLIAVLIASIFIHKKLAARKAAKSNHYGGS